MEKCIKVGKIYSPNSTFSLSRLLLEMRMLLINFTILAKRGCCEMKVKVIKGPLFEQKRKQAYELIYRIIAKKVAEKMKNNPK